MPALTDPLDVYDRLMANLPLDVLQAGFAQIGFNRGAGVPGRVARITAEGELRIAHTTRLFDCDFNGATAGALLNNQWNQQGTTLATALNAGFLRFNSAAVTTVNTGVSINTWRTFFVRDHMNLKLSGIIKHENGNVQNKMFEFGFGYYDVAANQQLPMNEFVGFRWTLTGGLLAVLEYSSGGAPTTLTVPVNGGADGTPYSDAVARTYDVVIGEEGVDFYVAGVLVAHIDAPAGAAGLLKSGSYPIIVKLTHSATLPAFAPVFDLGGVSVSSIGPSADEDRSVLQVAMGRHALQAQAGVQGANGSTNSVPASASAPTALTPSTTVSGLVGLGGYGRHTITGLGTGHAELIACSFQNPAVPETAGAAANARSLAITDIFIAPWVVQTALTGGGAVYDWFVAWGGTALNLALADAIGTTAPGAKSFRKMPLHLVDSLAAAAASGTIASRTGDGHIPLQTPILLAPGEFIVLGTRTLFAGAAISAGVVDGSYGMNGYWL
jgi:hypothetical protein